MDNKVSSGAVAPLGLVSPSAVTKGVTPPYPHPRPLKSLVIYVDLGPNYTKKHKEKTLEFGVKHQNV